MLATKRQNLRLMDYTSSGHPMRQWLAQCNEIKDLTSEEFCGLLCVGGDSDDTTNNAGANAAGADLKSNAA